MKTEICANCERVIGKLEQACVYEGNVVCPECDKALRGNAEDSKPTQPKVQTIEQTGKLYKAGIVVGVIIVFIGAAISWSGETGFGLAIGLTGAAIYFLAKLLAWWFHA